MGRTPRIYGLFYSYFMGRGTVMRGMVVAVGVAMLGAACAGGSSSRPASTDPDSQPDTEQTAATGTTTANDAVATSDLNGGDGPAEPSTTTEPEEPSVDIRTLDRAELIDRWADDRAAAVRRIVENGWGVDDDNVLRGPGDLRIDLDDCPAGWTDEGPERPVGADPDARHKDGVAVPLSWWEPYHGPGVDNAKVFLDWLGQDGYADGRPIDLAAHSTYAERDPIEGSPYVEATEPGSDLDMYNDELVAETAAQAFAAVGLRTWHENAGFEARFDRACLPSLGRRGSTDGQYQERSPWSAPAVDLQQVDAAEALARYAGDHLGDRRIGLLIMDNEFGELSAGPLMQLAESGSIDLVAVRHDPAAATLDGPLDELLAADPDIVIAATAGHPCLLTLQGVEVRRSDVVVLLTHFCDSIPAYLEPAGTGADGALALRSTIGADSRPLAGSALGELAEREFGSMPYSFFNSQEWPLVWHTVQVLQIAAELPGGLTRSNAILAAWSFEGSHPQIEGPVTVSWADDPRAVTEVRLYRYSQSSGEWEQTDTVVDLTGPAARS